MIKSEKYYGAVLLINVSYSEDPTQNKLRPVLVVSNDDFICLKRIRRALVAPLTRNVSRNRTRYDIFIEKGTEDFKNSGLKETSCIRIDKMHDCEFDYIDDSGDIKPVGMRVIGKMSVSFMKNVGDICGSIFKN